MYVALLSKSLAKIKEKQGKTFQLKLNTSYLTDSYIGFTLKIESVSKNTIFGLKRMVKRGEEFQKYFF